jgi:DNA relaxase NicK
VHDVVANLMVALGATEVEQREGGQHSYDTTHVVGPVKVWSRLAVTLAGGEADVCVEVTGQACEALGPEGLVKVWDACDWKAMRVDLAVDGCGFTPAQLRDAWRVGDVNTRVKALAEGAREGREDWRRHEWVECLDGDMLAMGSRASSQYARCYNTRGFIRFELELKNGGTKGARTAATVVSLVVEALRSGDQFGTLVVGLVQRFVRFVDRTQDSNLARCLELTWWAEFMKGVGRARLMLGVAVVKSPAEMLTWALRQVAPTLAVLRRVFGAATIAAVIDDGELRLRGHHRDSLRLAGFVI